MGVCVDARLDAIYPQVDPSKAVSFNFDLLQLGDPGAGFQVLFVVDYECGEGSGK